MVTGSVGGFGLQFYFGRRRAKDSGARQSVLCQGAHTPEPLLCHRSAIALLGPKALWRFLCSHQFYFEIEGGKEKGMAERPLLLLCQGASRPLAPCSFALPLLCHCSAIALPGGVPPPCPL